MSLEPSGLPRSSSPASSEASLPKPPNRPYEDAEGLKKDKSYRRYAANVDRALSLFDTALQEWADYISFLSRLLKALQTHPPSLYLVPNKLLVAKRLAQCLNPALPSGVHQKALEVYGYIFGLLKSDGLARDLAIYLPGIAPTLSFASLSVRPIFLSLIESHILQLSPTALRPAIKSIILALLPGLEDETSEDFEETLKLVDKLREVSSTAGDDSGAATGSQYFWQCMFLASVTNPSRRVGALAYLNRHLPKLAGKLPSDDIVNEGDDYEKGENRTHGLSTALENVTSPEPGLLIRCFATGLADEQVLIQRNFLDLLVTHLPLHSSVLQRRITSGDLELLVGAAAGVVIRRDMSLNRRLWAWLLGPDFDKSSHVNDAGVHNPMSASSAAMATFDNDSSKSHYFEQFGFKPLVSSIKSMLAKNSSNPNERSRPYRISLSLMDRWEVGGLVVPEVFLPVIRSTQRYKHIAKSKTSFDEVFRSASAFFDGVESSLIFSELVGLVLSPRSSISRPNLHGMNPGYSNVANSALDEIGSVANLLVRLVPERAFTPHPEKSRDPSMDNSTTSMNNEQVMKAILNFYSRSKDSLRLPEPPFSSTGVATIILREAQSLIMLSLESDTQTQFLKERLNLFVALLSKMQRAELPEPGKLYEAIEEKLTAANDDHSLLPMSVVNSAVFALTSLYSTKKSSHYISYEQIADLIPVLVQQLWDFLEPANLRFHVEAAACLWLLHSVSWRDHLVEAAITSVMISSSTSSHQAPLDQAEKFFVLWNHSHHSNTDSFALRTPSDEGPNIKTVYRANLLSQPLFNILGLLSSGSEDTSLAVRDWLRDLPSTYELFRVILLKFRDFHLLQEKSTEETSEFRETMILNHANQCIYMLQLVRNVLSALSPAGWSLILSNTATQPSRTKSVPFDVEENKGEVTIQAEISQICFHSLHGVHRVPESLRQQQNQIRKEALSLLRLLLSSTGAEKLLSLDIDSYLLDHLSLALDEGKVEHQSSIIDALTPVLKMRYAHHIGLSTSASNRHQRKGSFDISRMSFSAERSDKSQESQTLPQPPAKLLDCLLKGISSKVSRPIIDKWVNFLAECLPLYYKSIFKVLLTLAESFCKEISSSFNELQDMFQKLSEGSPICSPEHTTIALLSGLETCVATAHDRLQVEEVNTAAVKSPDQPQGFFGSMFASEGAQAQPTSSNNTRLTVLLCFQDAVQLCYSIWAWGPGGRSKSPRDLDSVASFQYTSLRMRNRARRILEHLFAAEALECLETLIKLWRTSIALDEPAKSRAIFSLLHTLDGSKPKVTIPAIFNAIYSRTSPAALEPSRKSSMSSELSETDLAAFLVMYAKSLDDDFLDDIWGDCITFLKDVLTNPFPHRQILPRLLEFAVVLGGKMENTTFGDDRRTRRELGDLILRLLPAIFTSKPLSGTHEPSAPRNQESEHPSSSSLLQRIGPDDIIGILSVSLPTLTATLDEADRVSNALSSISTNIISPVFHSRLFPSNVDKNTLDLLQQISKVQGASKIWKKDVSDAFNDSKFFGFKFGLVKSHWIRLFRQWALTDTERLTEVLTRLTSPTSAGIMFGVGASAARLEADRKAQLNLRRIALLIIASDEDHFSAELSELQQKLEDLLAATHVSSPSSVTRAEIYMVLRALILRTGSTSIAPFWPMISTELQDAISAISPDQESESFNPYSLLQAAKLLETLLLVSPDDFQLQEWLFVTDTIDVVYPPNRWESRALADELSRSLGKSISPQSEHSASAQDTNGYDGGGDDESVGTGSSKKDGFKKAWLNSDLSRETAKDEIIEKLLRPFFDRLSIHSFETMYSMGVPDIAACTDDLLADLFNEFTIVS
ncbi:protein kinase subdomain-containing protein [Trichophyton tonsurans CBS 112818]|uniref:Protein kinase subdomain-containing protein n=1 Tax=Trichophyton tonsurans (strain CBS 112818) TaxID=647933 RepID=F2RVP0_TRIT1|nr:protein kinase subdomain-containing protein [Trichophyton tonsurans CBS 112818]